MMNMCNVDYSPKFQSYIKNEYTLSGEKRVHIKLTMFNQNQMKLLHIVMFNKGKVNSFSEFTFFLCTTIYFIVKWDHHRQQKHFMRNMSISIVAFLTLSLWMNFPSTIIYTPKYGS